jgi:DNA-binding NarL/FixJ family response regulator
MGEGNPFVQSGRTAVVLDRHLLWAEAVEHVMNRVGVEIVGKATSGVEALLLIQRLRPDLLVTDIDADDGSVAGLKCLQEARKLMPGLRGIVLASSEDEHQIDAALHAGASAYVVKTAHPDDFASAVRQAFSHSVYFAHTTRRPKAQVPDGNASADQADLTKREREILRLAAEGHSNAQLASILWVTEQTVKFHLSNVYRKLNVSNRTEAARWAQVHGLVALPSENVAA